MKSITADALKQLAHQAVHAPRGLGNPALAANPESWAPYLRFLHLVVREYRPEIAVELGVYMGTATAHMALACAETFVIGVDIAPHEAFGRVTGSFPNVWLVRGDSVEGAPEVARLAKGRPIGLLFLDTVHDGDTPRREFEAYEPMLADGALVCCDDLLGPEHLRVKMQEFWRWLPGEKLELHELHPRAEGLYLDPGFGVSIWRRGA